MVEEVVYTKPLNEKERNLVNAAADSVSLVSKKSGIRWRVDVEVPVFVLRDGKYADSADVNWRRPVVNCRQVTAGQMIDLILKGTPDLEIAGHKVVIGKVLTIGCQAFDWTTVKAILDHRDLRGKLALVTDSCGIRFIVKDVNRKGLDYFSALHATLEPDGRAWLSGSFTKVTDVYVPGLTPLIKDGSSRLTINYNGCHIASNFIPWKTIEEIYDRRDN
jgi:hypothetical protein